MSAATSAAIERRPGAGRAALLVVLATESFFFATMLSAYFFLRANHPEWALPRNTPFALLFPAANFLLLLGSAGAVGLSNKAISRDEGAAARRWLGLGLLMGAVFIVGQIIDFRGAGLAPADPAFGGVFLALMGFHALHLLAGMGMLIIGWVRIRLGDFGAAHHETVTLGAWFWYFVVLVWAVLCVSLFLV
jgi:cytochrome c oxidase subunit 3